MSVQSRLRILLIEPNRYHSLLMERELTKEIPLAVVVKLESGSAGLEELYRAGYDVVILDS